MKTRTQHIFGISKVTVITVLNAIGVVLVAAALTLTTGCARSRDIATGDHGLGGLVLGTLAGTVVGTVVWAHTEVRDHSVGVVGYWLGGPEPDEPNPAPILIGAAVGGAVGFLIGNNMNFERWERASLERYGVAVKATRDGGRAGVFWEF